jgi:hypothetical protein
MKNDLTTAEAMIFAVAVYDAVKAVDPTTPSLIIMETASRVDFKADDIPSQVWAIVHELTNGES